MFLHVHFISLFSSNFCTDTELFIQCSELNKSFWPLVHQVTADQWSCTMTSEPPTFRTCDPADTDLWDAPPCPVACSAGSWGPFCTVPVASLFPAGVPAPGPLDLGDFVCRKWYTMKDRKCVDWEQRHLCLSRFFLGGGGGGIADQKIFAGEDGRDRERESMKMLCTIFLLMQVNNKIELQWRY